MQNAYTITLGLAMKPLTWEPDQTTLNLTQYQNRAHTHSRLQPLTWEASQTTLNLTQPLNRARNWWWCNLPLSFQVSLLFCSM